MKTKILLLRQKMTVVILFTVCALFTFSCQSSEKVDDLMVEMGVNGDKLSLLEMEGSKWELAGLYYSESETLKAPDNGPHCSYTLSYFSKEIIEGHEYLQFRSFGVTCVPSHYLWISEKNIKRGLDGLDLILDEHFHNIFWDWWQKIISYSISNTEMKLYTSDNHNYLLYKKLKK